MATLHCDPASDESLALMKGWLDNCKDSHQPCITTQQLGGPKRLLQCLPDGSVRLEMQSPTQRRDYIALSYCWGDGTAVKKTKKATEGDHQRGIPSKDLPLLFQEAVALARGLDTTYLWIDSLCIIQDSKEDKEEEMMQVSNIFSGALVVVVVASAESPLDSLLRVKPQPAQSHTWRTASLIRHKEMDLDVKFRQRDMSAHTTTDATFSTPAGRQAWCFQERLLASRCLVFRGDEVVWECRSCCLCECGGEQKHFSVRREPTMEPYRQGLLPLAKHGPFQLDGTLKTFPDAEAAYSFWEATVWNYSRRELKLRTDRLPAISAVASIVAKATGDRYLAGLWRNDLLAGLCWVTAHQGDPRPHQEYIAPTWSWAPLPGAVLYTRSRDADHQATVINAWTVLKGPDPYGPVSDGAIVLSGVHCDVEMKIREFGEYYIQLDFGRGQVEKVGNVDTMFTLYQLDSMQVEPDTDGDRLDGNPRYLRRVTKRQTDGLRLPRQPGCSGTVRLLWLHQDLTLILTPSRRKGKEEAFERLGIFHKPDTPKMPKTVQRSRITLV